MDSINVAEWIATPQGLAFTAAAAIVLITMIFVARQTIGFFLTLLFLLFALAAGLAIANKDLISDYLRGELTADDVKSKEASDQFKERIIHSYDELKANFDADKAKMKGWMDEWQEKISGKEKNQEEQEKANKLTADKVKGLEDKVKALTEKVQSKPVEERKNNDKQPANVPTNPPTNVPAPITVPAAP